MNDYHRRMLQQLIAQPEWEGLQAYFDDYLKRNFTQASIKRDNEFETMWQAAQNEGGKMYLQAFFDGIIEEARKP